ncbi:MAG: hypothetical protein KDC19_12375 [Saprospiraceae bacterium]|nr:hypothetical protein [Saprospiraceae bacterium]
MSVTETGTKKFIQDEQLAMIPEAPEDNVFVTLVKVVLYIATFTCWWHNLIGKSEDGLNHRTLTHDLAEKELEGESKWTNEV